MARIRRPCLPPATRLGQVANSLRSAAAPRPRWPPIAIPHALGYGEPPSASPLAGPVDARRLLVGFDARRSRAPFGRRPSRARGSAPLPAWRRLAQQRGRAFGITGVIALPLLIVGRCEGGGGALSSSLPSRREAVGQYQRHSESIASWAPPAPRNRCGAPWAEQRTLIGRRVLGAVRGLERAAVLSWCGRPEPSGVLPRRAVDSPGHERPLRSRPASRPVLSGYSGLARSAARDPLRPPLRVRLAAVRRPCVVGRVRLRTSSSAAGRPHRKLRISTVSRRAPRSTGTTLHCTGRPSQIPALGSSTLHTAEAA